MIDAATPAASASAEKTPTLNGVPRRLTGTNNAAATTAETTPHTAKAPTSPATTPSPRDAAIASADPFSG